MAASVQTFSGLSITVPVDKIKAKLARAVEKMAEERTELLEKIGIAALSDVQQDYRNKARGQPGADGEAWLWIQVRRERRQIAAPSHSAQARGT